jgi:hypothetical protein
MGFLRGYSTRSHAAAADFTPMLVSKSHRHDEFVGCQQMSCLCEVGAT